MLKHAHQGRKGQTVIYCETQVQNNFKDKLKRVRSPWLIVIYCETQLKKSYADPCKPGTCRMSHQGARSPRYGSRGAARRRSMLAMTEPNQNQSLIGTAARVSRAITVKSMARIQGQTPHANILEA